MRLRAPLQEAAVKELVAHYPEPITSVCGRGALGLAVKADSEERLERTQARMPARVASNPGGKPGHRKPKVSDATYVDVGLGGPKSRSKGVDDG